jgi:beta-phosphoglucomutase-like phosphatase (HAD superfamily)
MDGIKGVFFDLHGTLLISEDISKAWDEWRKAFHGCMVDSGLMTRLRSSKSKSRASSKSPSQNTTLRG